MPKLRIDNHEIEVPPGTTLLDAAKKVGIEIPTLCFLPNRPPLTSCLACVVKVNGSPRLLPACATKAAEGMVVESETPEVHAARRTALDLLLGDHLGDCVGPCQSVCPAHMDIPLMLRQISAGDLRAAIVTVKDRIALPAVLGRICPELCEHGCRRAALDGAVPICLLKRYVADADLATPEPYLPPCRSATGKRVAIVGAGPAGLAAAWYLLQQGHACTIFDEHDQPGGNLRYAIGEDLLPRAVLDAEIGLIVKLGAQLRMKQRLGAELSLDALRAEYAAVLLAIGEVKPETAKPLGLEMAGKGLKVNRATWMTARDGVFVAGSALAPARHAVRACGNGRCAALAIGQYLAGQPITVDDNPWSVHIGRLAKEEFAPYLKGADRQVRAAPAAGRGSGFTPDEARCQAGRCVECDCGKLEGCKLRLYAVQYGAGQTKYKGERKPFQQDDSHPEVIYEPGKCISCGLCVQIAVEQKETLGLSFVGRGFNVKVAVPFNESLRDGLRKAARACAEACPTGALVLKPAETAKPGAEGQR